MKEYLLLRKNVQSGPFSLKELLSQSLQADDLIWVEGHSYSWRHPHEIEELWGYTSAPLVSEPVQATDIPATAQPAESQRPVVAIRPAESSLSIKTVKASPTLVKVAVREKETMRTEEAAVDTSEPNGKLTAMYAEKPATLPQNIQNTTPVPARDNRMELFVLAVGAVSLLAVLYLLVTTRYT